MRLLLVGDPHAVVAEIADCERLIDCVCDAVREGEADAVVFMGDLYHQHAIVHLSVFGFWKRAFQRIQEAGAMVYSLVGNHDQAQAGGEEHALEAHRQDICVIDSPTMICDGVGAIPYCHGQEEFDRSFAALLDKAGERGVGLCLTHQSFQGARFEAGFYDPSGLMPPGCQIISGHIHSPQTTGNVRYIGAPRWRTLADAGVDERHLLLLEQGQVIREFPTSAFCRPIRVFHVKEQSDLAKLPEGDGWRVEIEGNAALVAEAEKLCATKGLRSRAQVTEKPRFFSRRPNIEEFLNSAVWVSSTPPAELLKMWVARVPQ